AALHQTEPRQDRFPARGSRNGSQLGTAKNATAVLDPTQSAALRDKLLIEVANLTSADFAVTWAAGALGAKNSLIAADAKVLEEAFEQKMSGLQSSAVDETSTTESVAMVEARPEAHAQVADGGGDRSSGIDKSVLAVAAPRRYRNREHLRYVALQPCLVCGRKPQNRAFERMMNAQSSGSKER